MDKDSKYSNTADFGIDWDTTPCFTVGWQPVTALGIILTHNAVKQV